jgi:cytochrome c oxidase subunit 2
MTMDQGFRLFPQSASTISGRVDDLYFFLIGVSLFFGLLICALIVSFSVRFRRSKNPEAVQIEGSLKLEVFWTAVPLALSMVMFGWGSKLFFDSARAPEGVMDVYVTAKQWMWKFQHPTGQREIDNLHVPVNTAIRLTMHSEDVIHSFFVPAFRTKRDVVPGRTAMTWFQATKVGEYHLFCAEYCGTKHSGMIGTVHVLEQSEYERWLTGVPAGQTPVEAGKALFSQLRCDTCHSDQSGARGPSLAGRFGQTIKLKGGGTVVFDEDYTRESIVRPAAKVVDGFDPLMPTYEGQVNTEQIVQLIAYIKSLSSPAGGP